MVTDGRNRHSIEREFAMLILQRKVGQSIQVSDNITITVTEFRSGGAVRIGISAPPGIKIVRSELIERDCRREEVLESDNE